MCGIIGVIGRQTAVNDITDGLRILENRGYDSAGVATLSPEGRIVLSKYASREKSGALDLLTAAREAHYGHTIGIGHTRWATHGAKTDANAHPHLDHGQRVAVVHNGVIENAGALRAELADRGIAFQSETDTEVIAQLIGVAIDDGHDLLPAIEYALGRLEGTWGLAILSTLSPNEIIAVRHGSPIVIGVGANAMFVASEPSAFSLHTREFIALENDELTIIRQDGHTLNPARIEHAPEEEIQVSPAPFTHWTIREIFEQPEAINRTLNHGARLIDDSSVKLGGLEQARERLLGIRHLVIAACGTSRHAAEYGAMTMRALRSFATIQVVDASEITPHHFAPEGAGLLVISQSGETKDVHRAVVLAQELDIPTFSIINAVGSLIARSTQCGVYLNAGRERGVASTKAFLTQVTALEMIAVWFSQEHNDHEEGRRHVVDDLRRLPQNVATTLEKRDEYARLAASLIDTPHCFILGKGAAEPIALEAALKIKEITYVHAEGYAGGALKHGPFALIEKGTPVFCIILDGPQANLMRTAAEEVRARGARTIVVTDKPDLAAGIADDTIVIPHDGGLTALLAIVPFQCIAYELAVLRGFDPDKPRNLAKAVTVD